MLLLVHYLNFFFLFFKILFIVSGHLFTPSPSSSLSSVVFPYLLLHKELLLCVCVFIPSSFLQLLCFIRIRGRMCPPDSRNLILPHQLSSHRCLCRVRITKEDVLTDNYHNCNVTHLGILSLVL